MEYDRSRFIDRELLDPHHVMQAGPGQGPVGVHTEGNLDFLKKPVDLGVRRRASAPPFSSLPDAPCLPARRACAGARLPQATRAWRPL